MKNLFLILFLLGSFTAEAKDGDLKGKVSGKDSDKSGIPGAVITWEGTRLGTSTQVDGTFELSWPDSFPAHLIVRATGYKGKKIKFTGKDPKNIFVSLESSADTLGTVVITETQMATDFLFFPTINGERINARSQLKAACCNLSESFETNPSVDAAMTDAVSGAKKISMLGMDGVYSQIMFENLPLIRGLSSSYGLTYVPGTWVKSILITKGTGSVVNGYESIAGQLNIDLLKPGDNQDPFFFNLYANQMGRYEMNVHVNKSFSPLFGTTLLGHASTMKQRNDNNHDGFLDQPTYDQYNLMNRWYWQRGDRAEGQFGFRMVYDDRSGGQFMFDKSRDYGTTNYFGIGIRNIQAEVFNKTGIVFDKPGRSLGTMFSARYHKQNMFFGLRTYDGEQKSLYVNLIWQDIVKTTDHIVKVGTSLIYDDYIQSYMDSSYDRTEIVPGIFAEYTGILTKKFSMVAGVRGDYHNLAGFQVTPRLHLKYNPTDSMAIRVSGGKGFRMANVFTESSMLFASARQVVISPDLDAEIAWNYGGSVQQKFKLFNRSSIIVIDFFRTDFVNQVLYDFDTPGLLKIYNLKGKSFANSFQADLSFQPIERFDVRMAYKFYDVQALYNGEMKNRPLVPRHRGFVNLAYHLPYDKWMFDFTMKWIGPTRIPAHLVRDQQSNVSVVIGDTPSPSYFVFNAHVVRKFRKIEVYAGVENIGNLMQKNPVLGADNPFGADFDASLIYAPTDGRTIYAGLRIKI
ncbi:MAG TPA: TonB-dependent receptor [Bacteroidia bacterium]|nr:TonB-dependent receptor [Bacteroidia bacterium]